MADEPTAELEVVAVVTLLYGCGLRRSEAVALDLADYDAEAGEVRVWGAKGRKDRITYAAGARKTR
jgi:site-specific recombinase XerD